MNETLLSAITITKPWLQRFTRFAYREAFAEYTKQYGELYRQEIDGTMDPGILAESLLDGLQAHWKKQLLWNRTAARIDCRQMVILYLSPMLMKQGEEEFSELLRQRWSERWPDTEYRVSSYEKLLNGFRNSVLGIDLANKHYEDETDS